VTDARTGVSRRAVLGVIGVGMAGVAGGAGWYLIEHKPARATVAAWAAKRADRYYIAHRGSGDVFPEHTVPAYQAALEWGAPAIEVSTSSTADGVLICMHDLTYDRTTNLTGIIHSMPSSVLSRVRVIQPQLGPEWLRDPPRVPLFEEVLRRFGGRTVLCVEAKRDADFPAMVALIESHGLADSVILKVFQASRRIKQAQDSGYPVFAYFGSSDATIERVRALAARLNPSTDYLVLPTSRADGGQLDIAVVASAVSSGVPVWAYPVHRRSEADYFFGNGVVGVIASSYGYVSRRPMPANRTDTWRSRRIAPGEMTKDPGSKAYAPRWTGEGELTLDLPEAQHFVAMGQFAMVLSSLSSYRINVEVRWNTLPLDLTTNVTISFAHADDRYYEHRLGQGNGYHAILRANGSLELCSHRDGVKDGVQLARPVLTQAPVTGEWIALQVTVDGQRIRWQRDDGPRALSVLATADEFRGSYLHIGRSSTDDRCSVSFRGLRISQV